MPVELSALFERKYAPVAQWIEQLTSDYPGRCAVARAWAGERNGPGYPLSRGSLALSPIQRMDGPAPIRLSTRSGSANRTALKPTSARLAAVSRRRTAYRWPLA